MLIYFVLMTSIFVDVFIISFTGDRLKQEVLFQFQTNIPQSNTFGINLYNNFSFSFNLVSFVKKSERIRETSYFLPWYDFPEDVAKNLKTIILRTYLPSSLSGAKIMNISLQAFCDVSPHLHWSAKIFGHSIKICRYFKFL